MAGFDRAYVIGGELVRRKGFTVLEIILGIAIGAGIALVAYVMLEPVRGFVFTEARRAGMSAGEITMLRMIKEIGHIKDPSQISAYTPTQITFTDYDNNVITFQLSGTDILRNGSVLARDVQNMAFEYLDKDGLVTAVPADMRVVKVSFTVNMGGETISLSSAERIRNLP